MGPKTIRLMLVCCLGLGMVFHALPAFAQSQPTVGYDDRAGGHGHRIAVVLHADHAPNAGELATLTLTATPELDAPDLLFEWLMPEGVELLNGVAAESAGAVSAGHTVTQL